MSYVFENKPKYKKNRPVYGRIPIDYDPMQDLSINITHMLTAIGGYQYLLVIMCDQTNFTIVTPLRSRDAQTVAETLIYRVLYISLDHHNKLYVMKQQNLHHILYK